jgi:hypothetical protein
MGVLKGKAVKRICSIPHCKNTDTLILTRATDYGAYNNVYICKDCASELYVLYFGAPHIDTVSTAIEDGNTAVTTNVTAEVKNPAQRHKPPARKKK